MIFCILDNETDKAIELRSIIEKQIINNKEHDITPNL